MKNKLGKRENCRQDRNAVGDRECTWRSLLKAIVLCGSMFGLGVRRHRKFETLVPDYRARMQA